MGVRLLTTRMPGALTGTLTPTHSLSAREAISGDFDSRTGGLRLPPPGLRLPMEGTSTPKGGGLRLPPRGTTTPTDRDFDSHFGGLRLPGRGLRLPRRGTSTPARAQNTTNLQIVTRRPRACAREILDLD